MPDPQAGETQEEFMSRCIPMVIDDGSATSQDQAVAICMSKWEKKSLDGLMVSFGTGSEVKSLGNGKYGGYLCRFSSPKEPDLSGDFFTRSTEFGVMDGTNIPLFYNHGMDGTLKTRRIGRAVVKFDDAGMWLEAQLEARDEYELMIAQMADDGKMGLSSGAAGHLVEREQVGKAWWIKTWIVAEGSFTPTPAEPRNMVVSLKSLSVAQTETEPKQEAEAAQPAQIVEEKAEVIIEKGVNNMTLEIDETKLQEMLASASEKAAQAAIKAFVAAQPSEKEPDVEVVEDEADRALKGGWKQPGEFFMAVKNAALYPAGIDKRLLPLKEATKAAAGSNEAIPSQGGFLVDSTIAPGIVDKMYNTGTLLSLFNIDPVGPNSNGMTYKLVDESSRADGSRHGGIRGYWLAEAGSKTSSKPSFRELELKLKKVAALCYASDEMLEDSTFLGSWLQRVVPDELRFKVEDAIVNGDGVGKPLGYVNSPAVIALNPATINTAIAADVLGMWARRWVGVNDYIWLTDQSVIPQLAAMTIGDQPVWYPPGYMANAPGQGMLLGRPLYEVEYCAALSSTDYFLHLVSPSQYGLIAKGGVQSASSIHVNFTTDETAFRFVYRVDGAPMWDTTLTTKSGGTVSPFILLGSTTP